MRVADPQVVQTGAAAREPSAPGWIDRYARALVAVDLGALLVTGLFALLARFGTDDLSGASVAGFSYVLIALALAVGWLAVLGLSRCYEARFLGVGPDEYRRVGNASIRVTAAVALVAFGLQLQLSRGFLAVFLVLGTVLLLSGRACARAYLRRGRVRGRFVHRVLVVGAVKQVAELVHQLGRDPRSGLEVVAACVPGGRDAVVLPDGRRVPVAGGFASVPHAIRDCAVDTVAVAASPEISGEALRRLSYELEGTDVDLLVAPALTNITGTRVHVRPMAGVPLLHLDEPELTGARQGVKLCFDVLVAGALVLLLLPLLLAIAVLVRTTSPGPALFSQERVGRDGRPFRVLKFRSMYVDAEQRLADLRHLNEHDGVLFKMRDDPRVTPVGRWLRRYSLDELPQLLNVLRGEMSLVGPRPPLAAEVARYEGHAHRRLLVRPGITGLWQVSGRSDLSWDDTVRLDLQYVENWSLALDVSILLRTVRAVLGSDGAY